MNACETYEIRYTTTDWMTNQAEERVMTWGTERDAARQILKFHREGTPVIGYDQRIDLSKYRY